MIFGNLHASYFFIATAFLLLLQFFSERKRKESLHNFTHGDLGPLLTVAADRKRRKVRAVLAFMALALCILSLMRPQAGFYWEEDKRSGLSILIAVDTSRSMLAEDVKPNRLERAKIEAGNLVRDLKGDRIGLLGFSGSAFLLCPMTADYSGFMLALNSLDADTIPRGGTSISSVIGEALKSFGDDAKMHKALVLLTDGENHLGDPIAAAQLAGKEGLKIFSVGIGTEEGDLIPIIGQDGRRGFLKDKQGRVVKSVLQEGLLRRIALSSGGAYVRADERKAGPLSLYEDHLSKMEKEQFEGSMRKKYREWFQLPLSIALALLVLEAFLRGRKEKDEREGRSGVFAASLVLVALAACDPGALKEGDRFFAQGKYEEAVAKYKEILARRPDSGVIHYNLAVALYKRGNYLEAADHFTKVLAGATPGMEAKTSYNIGNCKVKAGEEIENKDPPKAADLYREALDYYRRATELEGGDEDFTYNYQLVKRKLETLLDVLKKQTSESGVSSSFPDLPDRKETDLSSLTPGKMEGLDDFDDTPGKISKKQAEALLEGQRLEGELTSQPADRSRKANNLEVEKDW